MSRIARRGFLKRLGAMIAAVEVGLDTIGVGRGACAYASLPA